MRYGIAHLTEITLDRKSAGRIRCDPDLIPAPGQYLMAHATHDPNAPLATPVFSAGACPGGFLLAPPLPAGWLPGVELNIRGPLGKGFQLPPTARFVALTVFGENPARLLPLMALALAQNAAVVLLAEHPPEGLPTAIEIFPLSALTETLHWADYAAFDAPRAALPALTHAILSAAYTHVGQILVETPMPCGGMSECAVCAISPPKDHKLACKDGPVFDLKTLLE